MSDRISIVYDANIDDLKTKLETLIEKNNQLKIAAAGASRAISDMTAAKKDFGSKIAITTKNITDNSISIRTNTKNIQENTLSISSSTKATQNNTAVVNTATNSYNSYSSAVNNASRASGGFKASTDLLTRAFQMLTARMIAFFAIDSMVNFGKELVNVERKFELLQNRINFVAGTTTGGEAIFSRLQRTANELGIGIEELTNGFSGFAIAAKMAGFSSAAAEDIFSKVATALRAAGANSLQTQRAFYALQQMLSKGVVAAEELRRQLGEALPGASDLMTRAYNRLHPGQELTNRQFTKMLEDGKIISAEILPEFARVLEEEFAPALSGKKNSLDAILTRISNQFIAFKMNLSNLDFLKNTFGGLALFLEDVNNVMTNEELSFSDRVDGLMRAGTRFNKFEIERQKELAAQGSFLAKYYLSGQRVLEESAEKAKRRVEEQTKNEAILLKNAEKQYEAYEKLNEIEQSRLETSLQMRITLADKDIQELSMESRVLKGLYETFGKSMKMTREEFDMLADAGERFVRAEIHKKLGGGADMSRAVTNQIQKERERLNAILTTTKATQNQDKALLDLIKTRRVADAQGGPAGGGADEANKKAIKNAKELLALEQTKLLRIKENTVAYVEQSKRVIEAENALLRLEKKDSPFDLGLSLEKNKKRLEELDKLISSFDPNVPEIIIEPEVSLEPMKELDKELQKIRQDELELAVVTAQKIVEATKKGTQERLNAEQILATEVAALEVFKIRISQDSEALKAEKIKLINEKLKNEISDLNTKEEKDTQKTQDKIVDILQRANDLIERNEGDTFNRRIARTKQMFEKMARDIKEAMSQTQDFALLGELTKKLGEVEDAGKQAVKSISYEEAGAVLDGFGKLYGNLAKVQTTAYENDAISLKKQLDQKLITEQEYERKAAELARKRFEHEKRIATVTALIDGAAGIMKLIGKGRWWEIGFITAATTAQIAAIQSQQFPGFKEGVIDLQGPGTETSDSIPARLSRGESVMTADETKRYKPVLQAIRDNEFEAFVAKRYTDAMRKQDGGSSSFAENVSNSFDMQTAELATLLKQNRKVAIKNVDEFARAISRRSTTEKVINRRRFK